MAVVVSRIFVHLSEVLADAEVLACTYQIKQPEAGTSSNAAPPPLYSLGSSVAMSPAMDGKNAQRLPLIW
ncbi:unnamed protein product [Pleuronectes platessa]|uniref:Uncharacterized protein n=1 Tax=Pleuronectes platessa TaxID=8262 RepID=A0A9N7YIT3_PLEPL|nr:unnamed protein product [Pleuronectes platessa]